MCVRKLFVQGLTGVPGATGPKGLKVIKQYLVLSFEIKVSASKWNQLKLTLTPVYLSFTKTLSLLVSCFRDVKVIWGTGDMRELLGAW